MKYLPACAECGFVLSHPDEYHPYAACLMYKSCKDENTVRENLKAVMDFGVKRTEAADPLDSEPVHRRFGLSYASWLVWPRVVMQAMPLLWQQKFCKLADEMDEKFPHWSPEEGTFQVGLRVNGKITKLPEELCNYRRPVEEYRGAQS